MSFGSESTAIKILYRMTELADMTKVNFIENQDNLVASLAYVLTNAFKYEQYKKLDDSLKNKIRESIATDLLKVISTWKTWKSKCQLGLQYFYHHDGPDPDGVSFPYEMSQAFFDDPYSLKNETGKALVLIVQKAFLDAVNKHRKHLFFSYAAKDQLPSELIKMILVKLHESETNSYYPKV